MRFRDGVGAGVQCDLRCCLRGRGRVRHGRFTLLQKNLAGFTFFARYPRRGIPGGRLRERRRDGFAGPPTRGFPVVTPENAHQETALGFRESEP